MAVFIKICGITQIDQAQAIAQMGVQALGFIAVPQTPRFVSVERIRAIVANLPPEVEKVGVYQNVSPTEIVAHVEATGLTMAQLHGDETVAECRELAERIPQIRRIKAFRPRSLAELQRVFDYADVVDWIHIDAYHPQMAGGTGMTADWDLLQGFSFPRPWLLAGGLKPENVAEALQNLHPNGIDLSSGVESSPGNKVLGRIQWLLQEINQVMELLPQVK